MDEITVGIIGMGDMGRMYARRFSEAGWRINACDRPEMYDSLKREFEHKKGITILEDGHLVSRDSDWIMYSVEAELIDQVVSQYGRSTKKWAVVGGQTSCKAPELAAFDKHLPEDVDIVSCHSLHGPGVDTTGQPLVVISHRARRKGSVDLCVNVLSCLKSKIVYLTGEEHDRITADTQAVTHAAFLSMGTAWAANKQFPWDMGRYVGGIENVKINITLRIYSNKWHVYAGLAVLNPSAKKQIRQYAASVTDLFKLMLGGHRTELERRIKTAGAAVFGHGRQHDLLLRDDVLDQFSLSKEPKEKTPNNHLSLLAIVDCWWKLGIVPYDHMICSTPLFRIWLGVTEYLFRNERLLDEVIKTAIEDNTFRSDDLEFTFAARAWSECVDQGAFEAYRIRFEAIQKYFEPRFPEAVKIGNDMIKTIMERTKS